MDHDADIKALQRQLDEANAALGALRESEAHYRSLYNSFDEGFMEVEVVQDADGRYIDIRYLTCNPALERLTGLKDVEGRLLSEVLPDPEPEWVERYGYVARTGEAIRFEMPASGLGRWFSVYLARLGHAGSRRVVAVYNDITERKRAELASRENEERKAFLLRFSDALRAEPSAEAIAERALRMLSEQMQLDRCYVGIYRLAEDRGEFPHQVHDNRLLPLPANVRLSSFPKVLRIAFERTLVIDDVLKMEGLSDSERASFDGIGVVALITATLRKGENNPLWAICAASSGPRVWTQDEVALVEEVAERTWAAGERARADAALRDSEARFAQFAASSTEVLSIRRADTMEMEYLSPAFATVYGVTPNEAMDGVEHWARLIVPEDRGAALEHLESARRGEAVVHEFRIRRPSDGAFRWIRNHDFPLQNDDGIKWIGGIATDVTEAKLSVEHQSILLAELQHRVRNILALLRALLKRTADTAPSVADYEALMTGRLMALARTQALLTRATNVGVEIGGMIRKELNAQAYQEGQYELSGPQLMISPKAAEVLSLAIHELATNALKYGAFSAPEGKVVVTWRVLQPDGMDVLRLDWTEHRPAPADWLAPTRKGFGSQLIEQHVPYELAGRGELEIRPQGAQAWIEFPLQPGASILETDAPALTTVFGGSIDMTTEVSLAGQTVLVLENDFYLAQDAASALQGAGAEVIGPCRDPAGAIEAMAGRAPTAAVLDINLGSGPSFEVAKLLRKSGVHFVFLTGYDQAALPMEFADVVRLQKPAEPREIVRAVAALVQS